MTETAETGIFCAVFYCEWKVQSGVLRAVSSRCPPPIFPHFHTRTDLTLTSVVVLVDSLEPADVVMGVGDEVDVQHAGLGLRTRLEKQNKAFMTQLSLVSPQSPWERPEYTPPLFQLQARQNAAIIGKERASLIDRSPGQREPREPEPHYFIL